MDYIENPMVQTEVVSMFDVEEGFECIDCGDYLYEDEDEIFHDGGDLCKHCLLERYRK